MEAHFGKHLNKVAIGVSFLAAIAIGLRPLSCEEAVAKAEKLRHLLESRR